MRSYSPGGTLNALAPTQERITFSYIKCTPFTVGTTRVSNPVCYPNFRASASVTFQRAAFATGVLLDINAFHRYSKNSALLSCTQAMQFLNAVPLLSSGISHPTRITAYAPFTPSKSEQRSPPLYYRGCWHRVSRGFLFRYHQIPILLISGHFSRMTGVYNPKAFILHAASLCQTFVHCKRSSTAASRRSLGSVSVPVWPITLSGRLPVCLGRPLPYQLADGTRVSLQVTGLKGPHLQFPRHATRYHIRY